MADPRVASALRWLEAHASKSVRDGMLRYAIPNDHALALALWKTGVYEAQMLCAYVDEPTRVTAAQMDAQARAFDNWAICDTLCFALWVRTPHAFAKIRKWATSRDEFVKRASFALLASVALKDEAASDAGFLRGLKLIEKAATDERNFVKKAVNWALRGIGSRNLALNEAAVALSKKLAASKEPAPRWIGKDALRQLGSPATRRRLAARS